MTAVGMRLWGLSLNDVVTLVKRTLEKWRLSIFRPGKCIHIRHLQGWNVQSNVILKPRGYFNWFYCFCQWIWMESVISFGNFLPSVRKNGTTVFQLIHWHSSIDVYYRFPPNQVFKQTKQNGQLIANNNIFYVNHW